MAKLFKFITRSHVMEYPCAPCQSRIHLEGRTAYGMDRVKNKRH